MGKRGVIWLSDRDGIARLGNGKIAFWFSAPTLDRAIEFSQVFMRGDPVRDIMTEALRKGIMVEKDPDTIVSLV